MLSSTKRLLKLFQFSTIKTPQVAVFSAKKYDVKFFTETNEKLPEDQRLKIDYFEEELNEKTAVLSKGYDTIVPFVNDKLTAQVVNTLAQVTYFVGLFSSTRMFDILKLEYVKNKKEFTGSKGLLGNQNGVDLIALRCAGFNNTDLEATQANNIKVVRVPAYSPEAVAEHSMALLLSLVRKIPKAHNRTKEGNFSLDGLLGFNLYQKKVGVIGAGKIGQAFMRICQGFGMEIYYSDPTPSPEITKRFNAKHVNLHTLFAECDVVSLHCPLTFQTQYVIDRKSLDIMKPGAIIINTGRGKLMRTDEVIMALKSGKLGGVGLDVYENESNFFFKDVSDDIMGDDDLARLLMYPNVIVTGHQAFFTKEAITAICEVTVDNILKVKQNQECLNIVTPPKAK